jgi:hypothetical protein
MTKGSGSVASKKSSQTATLSIWSLVINELMNGHEVPHSFAYHHTALFSDLKLQKQHFLQIVCSAIPCCKAWCMAVFRGGLPLS